MNCKLSPKGSLAAAILVLMSATGCTELHEYVIEGEVTSFDNSLFSPAQNEAISTFRLDARVEFQEFTNPPYINDGTTRAYSNIIRYFQLISSGAQLDVAMEFPESPQITMINDTVYTKANGTDVFTLELEYEEQGLRTYHQFTMTQLGSPFIELVNLYPTLFSGDYATTVTYTSETIDIAQETVVRSIAAEGTTNRVLDRILGDLDGDGIDDFADTCPSSNLDEEVTFDWVGSGVENYVDESGCSIMDRYAKCEAEEEEQPSSPWGWFQPVYSGPSYCEKQVVYGLQEDGVIDYTEGRMLRNALRTFYSSEEPRR